MASVSRDDNIQKC